MPKKKLNPLTARAAGEIADRLMDYVNNAKPSSSFQRTMGPGRGNEIINVSATRDAMAQIASALKWFARAEDPQEVFFVPKRLQKKRKKK